MDRICEKIGGVIVRTKYHYIYSENSENKSICKFVQVMCACVLKEECLESLCIQMVGMWMHSSYNLFRCLKERLGYHEKCIQVQQSSGKKEPSPLSDESTIDNKAQLTLPWPTCRKQHSKEDYWGIFGCLKNKRKALDFSFHKRLLRVSTSTKDSKKA